MRSRTARLLSYLDPATVRYVRRKQIAIFGGLILVFVGLVGCGKRQTRRGNSFVLPIPSETDEQARRRFEQARERYEQNRSEETREEFSAIARDFPNDPIVVNALLYGAMADLQSGNALVARDKLNEVKKRRPTDPILVRRTALLSGLSSAALGQADEQTLADLQAGEEVLNRNDTGEVSLWHAAMGDAAKAVGDSRLAITHYDLWWMNANPSEKTDANQQIEALVIRLTESELRDVFVDLLNRDGPAAAEIGRRLAPLLIGSQDPQKDQLLEMIEHSLRAMGISPQTVGDSGPGDPGVIGALLPMSGRLNRVGELSLRGLDLVSGFQILTRDTFSGGERVEDGMNQLVNEEAVAVIGPFDGNALGKASPMATRLGVPILSLSPRSIVGANVFNIRHSAEERARSLARFAVAKGVRDFAIFSPATSYGNAVGQAFQREVEQLGGKVAVVVQYPKGTTSFASYVEELQTSWSGIFVPDTSKTLQLIAPALAVENFDSRPVGEKSKHGRAVLLLSTAEGIDGRYLRSVGRYSFGALVAPGFYPDRTDASIADFVARYEKEFGTEPSSHEAYAYDAATVVRFAIDRGATTRHQISQALRRQSVPGVTGAIRFGAGGRRADPGLLFEIHEPIAGQYELQALR